jgi:hypothetical protein
MLSKILGYRGSALYKVLPAYIDLVPVFIALHEFAEPPPSAALKTSNTKWGQKVTRDAKTFETNKWVLAT